MSDIMTVENLKKVYPDVYGAIEKEAYDRGFALGETRGSEKGKLEGAEAERSRIKSIEDYVNEALILEHAELIATLKYDGTTTRQEAADKIGVADGQLRKIKLVDFRTEHTTVTAPAQPPVISEEKAMEAAADETLPPEERAKKVWDATPSVRVEFKNDFNAYKAFVIAEAAGQVKIYRGGN